MRHCEDWLSSYLEYAKDGYCPDKFHFWTGVSLIAGALERRAWLVVGGAHALFPNLYVFLVSKPGVGKSTASNRGVYEFLKKLGDEKHCINFVANHFSEAALVKSVAQWRHFYIEGKEYSQAAAFLYASEASNTFKEIMGGGSTLAMITELYDCPESWSKATQKDGVTTIRNSCFNVLAGCTFSFLNELIPEKNITGGLASRILYVVQDDLFIRTPTLLAATKVEKEQLTAKYHLFSDLQQIHSLAGRFAYSPEMARAFAEWFPRHDRKTQEMSSERMQAFLARKHSNVLKLAMICSVSEGNSLRIELRHWERALGLIEELEAKLPVIVGQSYGKESQDGINRKILDTLKVRKQIPVGEFRRQLLLVKGIDSAKLDRTLSEMVRSGVLLMGTVTGPTGPQAVYRIGMDMEKYT